MDKIQQILSEIERLQLCTMDEYMNYYSQEAEGEYNALTKLKSFIESIPKEPVKRKATGALKEMLDTLDCASLEKTRQEMMKDAEDEDLEEEIQRHLKDCLDVKFPTTDIASIKRDVEYTARHFAKWQQEQFEKNRLTACDNMTDEESEREWSFVEKVIHEEHRQPTYSDAIEYGRKLMKEEMIKDAVAIETSMMEDDCDDLTPVIGDMRNKGFKFGDRVKLIIIKEEQP